MLESDQIISYYEMVDEMKELEKRYPDNVRLEAIGLSRESQPIYSIIFGTGEKRLVASGGVHGREIVNPTVLLKMADYYLSNEYKGNLSGKIYLIPCLNPDGYEIARTKSVLWKENAAFVDLNRNFPSQTWRQKWQMDKAASEPETRALIRFLHQVNPDGYLDFHSRGKCIYYYRNQMEEDYNQQQKRIADTLAKKTGYELVVPNMEIEPLDSGGNTVHYVSEVFHIPALTIETVDETAEFPLSGTFINETYLEIRDMFEVFFQCI